MQFSGQGGGYSAVVISNSESGMFCGQEWGVGGGGHSWVFENIFSPLGQALHHRLVLFADTFAFFVTKATLRMLTYLLTFEFFS